MTFIRPEHEIIREVLAEMNHKRLLENKCYFAGSTAVVLRLDEYRLACDLEFLCASSDGYREIRNALIAEGPRALFSAAISRARRTKLDEFGIRMSVLHKEQRINFAVIREARVAVEGMTDEGLQVPALTTSDMFTQKLLANADHCYERKLSYRDAIDLGCLILAHKTVPDEALAKAVRAYGPDIQRKTVGIVNHLLNDNKVCRAATALQMDEDIALNAVDAVRDECRRLWPTAQIR